MNNKNNNQFSYAKISNHKVILRSVLTLLVTIALFVIILSRIEIDKVIVLLKQTDVRFLGTAILFSVFAHVIFSSARYQKVFQAVGCRISFFETVIIRMGCNPLKSILPSKMGELALVVYMKKIHNLSYPKGFFSLLFGYFFSFMVLIILCSIGGIFYFHNIPQRIIFALLFLLTLFLITPLSLRQIPLFLVWCLNKFQKLPKELTKSLIEKYDPQTIKIIILHSFGLEGSKLIIILILLKSFNMEIPLDALLLLGSTTIIAAYIPITYWGLGIRESAILFLFSSYATPDKLLAGSLLITFVDGVLPVLLGLLFLKPFLNRLLGGEKLKMEIISNDE